MKSEVNRSTRSDASLEDYVLVVAEKPDAARKIASALGHVDSGFSKSAVIQIPHAFDGNRYVVCSALGHLYEITDSQGARSVFPVFDIDWFPKVATGRAGFRFGAHNARRLHLIAQLSHNATKFVNACDFDVEGETIGTNILQFACDNPKTVWRAKFSTLVETEIRDAFANLKEQETSRAIAGKIRHAVDFLWGVNLSRALTKSATGSSGSFSNVTIGRVQGPTLAFVVQREMARQTHIPLPCWNIECSLNTKDSLLVAKYVRNPIETETEAKTVFESVSKAEAAAVTSARRFTSKVPPRYPFDLGELQREAFHSFGFSSSLTLRIAEKLYLSALISYPRTDSQKLPSSIQPLKILASIGKIQEYSLLLKSLFAEKAMRRIPWQGPRDDPAHPAIYPTGLQPRTALSSEERKLFDLVVRRFCNAFAPDAIIEKRRTSFDIGSNEFLFDDERIIEEGWMRYYPFRKVQRQDFDTPLEEGERLPISSATCEISYSKAPPHYNEATLLAKMESEGLGTKATRADIISTLFDRGYLSRSGLVPSENALSLFFELKDRCPEIMSSELTRELERKLLRVQEKGESEESILVESMREIRNSLRKIRNISQLQWRSSGEQAEARLQLGSCPNCKKGDLIAVRSSRSRKRFIRCENTECRISSPLPPRGAIRKVDDSCITCGWPMITISFRKGKRASPACSNYNCSSRHK